MGKDWYIIRRMEGYLSGALIAIGLSFGLASGEGLPGIASIADLDRRDTLGQGEPLDPQRARLLASPVRRRTVPLVREGDAHDWDGCPGPAHGHCAQSHERSSDPDLAGTG